MEYLNEIERPSHTDKTSLTRDDVQYMQDTMYLADSDTTNKFFEQVSTKLDELASIIKTLDLDYDDYDIDKALDQIRYGQEAIDDPVGVLLESQIRQVFNEHGIGDGIHETQRESVIADVMRRFDRRNHNHIDHTDLTFVDTIKGMADESMRKVLVGLTNISEEMVGTNHLDGETPERAHRTSDISH